MGRWPVTFIDFLFVALIYIGVGNVLACYRYFIWTNVWTWGPRGFFWFAFWLGVILWPFDGVPRVKVSYPE